MSPIKTVAHQDKVLNGAYIRREPPISTYLPTPSLQYNDRDRLTLALHIMSPITIVLINRFLYIEIMKTIINQTSNWIFYLVNFWRNNVLHFLCGVVGNLYPNWVKKNIRINDVFQWGNELQQKYGHAIYYN